MSVSRPFSFECTILRVRGTEIEISYKGKPFWLDGDRVEEDIEDIEDSIDEDIELTMSQHYAETLGIR